MRDVLRNKESGICHDSSVKCSIIVPVYNAGRLLEQAVNSIESQTVASWELIVCDDASRDGCCDFLEHKSKRDPRIRMIRNEVNIGPGPARDKAIDTATGKLIAFLDADDSWHPTRLEKMLNAWDGSETTLVFDDLMICHHHPSGDIVPWQRLRGRKAFSNQTNDRSYISFESYLVSSRLIIKPIFSRAFVIKSKIRHSSARFAEDADYICQLAAHGMEFIYLPEALYNYRVTPGSLTAEEEDKSVMRRTLLSCRDAYQWDQVTIDAFNRKVESLGDQEELYALAKELFSGRISLFSRRISKRPRLVLLAIDKALVRLRYIIHRRLNGGIRRDLK